ncbi:hypothetical protein AgCh_029478 [Apium graveolens]
MVETFCKALKVLGTEIEEFGDEVSDIGIGERESHHDDFMSVCKGYMIGNGVIDNKFDGNALVPFAHGVGRIPNKMFEDGKSQDEQRIKVLGAEISVSRAFLIIFYKGQAICIVVSSSGSIQQLLLSKHSNWVLGGGFLTITCFSAV